MPGTVVRTVASEGDVVAAGDTILVLEAMKMETEVKTEQAGTVSSILVDPSQAVASGDLLAVID
jgi:biotin carboxyl carrier protein